jgi:hypothetical protein
MASSSFSVRFNINNSKSRPSNYKVPSNTRPSSYKSTTSAGSRPSSYKFNNESKENEQEKQHEPFSRPSSFKIIESLSNIPIDERTIIPSTDFIPPRPSTEYLQPR